MTELVKKYNLADKPKSWLSRIFIVLAILSAIMSVVLIASMILLHMSLRAFSDPAVDGVKDTLNLSAFNLLEDVLLEVIVMGVLVTSLWMVAIIVGKIDQIVWLKSSNIDKHALIEKRKLSRILTKTKRRV